jgi:lipopolysaccharide biosynthesis glycosyltransferase
MKTEICTLFYGDFHYGVGVLANSLYAQGYRGVIWVGYSGPLPPWATAATQHENYQELTVNDGLCLRLIHLEKTTYIHFYKTVLLQLVLNTYSPDVDAVFFFDSDIINRGKWDFYERWATRGIAICEDVWGDFMPTNHPIRLAWKEYAEAAGYPCVRLVSKYYNSGFIGIHRQHKDFLALWENLINTFRKNDAFMVRNETLKYPYINLYDQDAMNIALMVSDFPISTVAPDGMDFNNRRGFLMSHAAAIQKPWRKKLISSALNGVAPNYTDKIFWQHTQSPLQVYPKGYVQRKQVALKIASAIGRFIRRS